MSDIINQLLSWYRKNGRLLPWRETSDPYRIWLSEIMLQQTRVDQGLPYYTRFVEKFPDVFHLATATEQEVFKLWQGLGYYSRARNLLKTAQQVVSRFGGDFPSDLKTLQSLPGIGSYTAAAVSSLAFGMPHPVVDGNVYRVIARLYGVTTPIPSTKAHNEFVKIAQTLMPAAHPALFNQAMMELGALVCTPKNPQCDSCPLRLACFARQHDQTASFPVQIKKTKQKTLYLYYIVMSVESTNKTKVVLRHRDTKGIWAGLYDFPCIETGNPLKVEEVMALLAGKTDLPISDFSITNISAEYKHLLTHRILLAQFISILVKKNSSLKLKKPLLLVEQSALPHYPVPVLVDRFLQDSGLMASG